jgi:drug/metabolite transporter (DMT)-like permease
MKTAPNPLVSTQFSPLSGFSQPVLIATFCLLWSSAFSVAKVALADCPPLILLAIRFLIAGIVMMVAATWLMRQRERLTWRDIAVLAVLGIANNALYLGLNYIGMQSVSSGFAALIVSANPVLTALLATLFLGEQMTWRKAGGLLLGVGGVAFIVGSRISVVDPVGVAFVLGALISLVTGTILFKRLAPQGKLWTGNAVQNLAGGLALVPFALTFESFGDVTPTWHLLAALAYLSLFGSVLGYLLWFHLLATAGATAASAYHFLMPPLGLMFGWLLLGERTGWIEVVGIVPVALGIYLVTHAVAAKARPQPARPLTLCREAAGQAK